MHYLLFYEKVKDFEKLQEPFMAAHRTHVIAAAQQGNLVLAGNLADPVDGSALLLFQCDSSATVEAFAQTDPYVTAGIISHWRLRAWDTIVDKYAAFPYPN